MLHKLTAMMAVRLFDRVRILECPALCLVRFPRPNTMAGDLRSGPVAAGSARLSIRRDETYVWQAASRRHVVLKWFHSA